MQRFFPLFLFASFAVHSSPLPPNNLSIPVSEKNAGLSERQFHQVIDRVEAVYRPLIEREGRRLSINRLWESTIVNAGTLPRGKEIIINLHGGYARHALATEDNFALVICHELGHHYGALPKKTNEQGQSIWASTEGQADYYATLKCLRKVFEKEDNLAVMAGVEIPRLVKEKCDVFPLDSERAICQRTSLAGLSTAKISAAVAAASTISFDKPDTTIVEKTFEAHPRPQCRLDTYFRGSFCEVSSTLALSMTDEATGTCHENSGYTEGTRPLCWFRPLPK
jgi:hypothetical protein